MQETYLNELLTKHKKGTISNIEAEALNNWYLQRASEKAPELATTVVSQRLAELHQAFVFIEEKETRTTRYWPKLLAAASIIVVLLSGILYFSNNGKDKELSALANIKPGGNVAYLVLSNGKRISLTDAANGDVANEAGILVTKTSEGKLIYTVSNTNSANPVYNTIETPKGGQYQVRLPDGSNVWLNADSKLKFLSSLSTDKVRRVELSGEAYFEVAKDKSRPFLVATERQQVQVLGTHFNVNSYADEPLVKTTLLEGSVRVSANGISKLIVPGEEAAFSVEGFRIDKVDTEDAIAWKNGKFVFEDEQVKSVMRKLARWYNVEVVFEPGAGDKRVTAQISRFDNISKILDKIKYIRAANFKIEEGRITVMQ